MNDYTLNIGVGVQGTPQINQAEQAVGSLTERTKKLNDAIYGETAATEKATLAMIRYATEEAKLEQLRERHRIQTEALAAGLGKQAAAHDALASATQRTVGSTQAASAALRTLEGAMPLRAAASFLGSIQGIGAAMQFAFPVFGAVALIEVLGKIPGEINRGILALEGWNDKSKEVYKKSTEDLDKYYLHLIEMNSKVRNLNLIGAVGLNRDALEVGNAKAELAEVQNRLAQLRKDWANDNKILNPAKTPGPSVGGFLTGTLARQFGARNADAEASFANAADVEKAKLRQMEREKLIGTLLGEEESLTKVAIPGAERQASANAAEELRQEQKALDSERRSSMERAANNPIASAILRGRYGMLEHPQLADQFAPLYMQDVGSAADKELRKNSNSVLAGIAAEPREASKVFLTQLHQQIKDDEEVVALMKQAISTWNTAEVGRVNTQVGTIRDTATRQGRLIAAGANPGDEISTLRQQIALRREAADQELQIKAAHSDIFDMDKERLVYTKEIGDLGLDYETKILELKRQQKEETVSMAVGLIMAAQHGGVTGFLKSQAEGIESKVLTNLGRAAIESPTGKSITDKLHAQDGTFMGKLLQGTPFGPDPMKAAGVTLNTAGVKLSAAADSLMKVAMSGSGGGGGLVRGSGGVLSGLSSGDYEGTGMSESEWNQAMSSLDGPASGPDATGGFSTISTSAGRSGGFSASKGIGIAAAAAGAAFGAYSGFKSGGARGDLAGAGSLAGGAGAIMMMAGMTGPAAPIVAGVGLALGLISSLLGDPKQARSNQIQSQLLHNQYMAPVAINASMSTGGTYADFDRFGAPRGSSFSPFPTVDQGFFDYRHGVTVPGRINSSFGGPGGQPPVVVNVQTIDSRSFNDNSHLVADALQHALQTGRAPGLQETLRRM